jgi:hypothetical protein
MVRLNVVQPRHEQVFAPPSLSASQIALIVAAWLAMMAPVALMVLLR